MNALKLSTLLLASTLFPFGAGQAIASSILPSTSVLIIEEADKEGSIGIKNTQKEPILLYSKVTRLEGEDLDAALIPVPAAVLVQPGETQIVRVLFRSNKKLEKEHLARIAFIGIPPKNNSNSGTISFSIGQDLPLVIRPKGYSIVDKKWEYLKWHVKNESLCVSNDTKLVIRFVNSVKLLPSGDTMKMPYPYALPNSENCTKLPNKHLVHNDIKVEFSAVTDYNYIIDERQANVQSPPL